jgi:NADH pyrophosphatase NudC (nudix superfamily)
VLGRVREELHLDLMSFAVELDFVDLDVPEPHQQFLGGERRPAPNFGRENLAPRVSPLHARQHNSPRAALGTIALAARSDACHKRAMAYEPPTHCGFCGAPLAPVPDKPGQRLCIAAGCGRITYLSPVPVVAAIVERAGHVILVRAHGWPESWYGLVTGFLEPAESPEEAARREVMEELRLRVETSRLIGAYPFARMNQVIIAYHVNATGEIVLDENELAGFKSVPLDKLRAWDFGTGAAVKDFLTLRRAEIAAQE